MVSRLDDGGLGVPLLGEIMVSARPYEEYLTMFGLDEARVLRGPVLDCPGGASSFSARLRKLGGSVVSLDPVYECSPQELDRRVDRELASARERALQYPQLFDFSWAGGLDAQLGLWRGAATEFLDDYTRHPGGYVVGALPRLPFRDRSFSLTLSGFLLFTYAGHFGPEGLLAAVRELIRVTDGEVRIHPLCDNAGGRVPGLDALLTQLSGVDLEVVDVEPTISPRASQTLVLRPRG